MSAIKFSSGPVAATPGALEALADSGQESLVFLQKHLTGDWGELDAYDRAANERALVDGSRLLSCYQTLKGERLYVITEAVDDDGHRAGTTLLLPDEY